MILPILPGGRGQLWKDGFVMLFGIWRDSTNMKLHRQRVGGFGKFIRYGVDKNTSCGGMGLGGFLEYCGCILNSF